MFLIIMRNYEMLPPTGDVLGQWSSILHFEHIVGTYGHGILKSVVHQRVHTTVKDYWWWQQMPADSWPPPRKMGDRELAAIILLEEICNFYELGDDLPRTQWFVHCLAGKCRGNLCFFFSWRTFALLTQFSCCWSLILANRLKTNESLNDAEKLI